MNKRQRKKRRQAIRQHYPEEKPEEELYTQIMAGLGRAEEFIAREELAQDEPQPRGYVNQDEGEKAA